MEKFQQNYKRQHSLLGLVVGVVFLGLAVDAEYFNFQVPAGLRQEGPWLFWLMAAGGALATLGAIGQLFRPPLILAADGEGVTLKVSRPSIDINLSISDFRARRKPTGTLCVPWEKVRSIDVDEVRYTVRDMVEREPALRIEFDDSVDLSGVGDMQGIQAGTEAYFEAINRARRLVAVGWQEPQGRHAKKNIVLIGQQHFDDGVDQVCERLRQLARKFSAESSR